jgi:hypothetical protein
MYEFSSGKLTGTGAEITVNLGFVPTYVKVINRTKIGTHGNIVALEWFEGMTAGHSLQYKCIDAANATAAFNINSVTTGGILPVKTENTYASGVLTTAGIMGFSIPAGFQSASDELYYVAMREVA